jgi:hypothetical protein
VIRLFHIAFGRPTIRGHVRGLCTVPAALDALDDDLLLRPVRLQPHAHLSTTHDAQTQGGDHSVLSLSVI